jgi:hypothetical protein
MKWGTEITVRPFYLVRAKRKAKAKPFTDIQHKRIVEIKEAVYKLNYQFNYAPKLLIKCSRESVEQAYLLSTGKRIDVKYITELQKMFPKILFSVVTVFPEPPDLPDKMVYKKRAGRGAKKEEYKKEFFEGMKEEDYNEKGKEDFDTVLRHILNKKESLD